MASGPIIAWQIDGEKVEVVTDFLFLGSKVAVDGDCSHEIRRWLLLGMKAMTNLDNVLKIRDITLPTKVGIVKAMFFPVVTYGCESWTVKKVECWRIDAFQLWCWSRLLTVPWTARRSNQSILREINPEYSLERHAEAEAPVFWLSDANSLLIGKVPDAGIDWRQKGKKVSEDEMAGWHHWCNEHELGQTPGDGEGRGGLVSCSPQGHKESDTTGQLNNNNEMMNVQ